MSNFSDKTAYIKLSFSQQVDNLKSWINSNVIDKINSKLKDAPVIGGWLGKHPIPHLAQGAVIPPNKQFLAVLGDQKRGTNIETPLQTMIEAFNAALAQNGGAGNGTVNVYLQGDAKQLFRVVRTEANNYTQTTGKAAFNL